MDEPAGVPARPPRPAATEASVSQSQMGGQAAGPRGLPDRRGRLPRMEDWKPAPGSGSSPSVMTNAVICYRHWPFRCCSSLQGEEFARVADSAQVLAAIWREIPGPMTTGRAGQAS